MASNRCYLIFALMIYYIFAFNVLGTWQIKNAYPVTGDEPHYLVMASGIIHYGTFEQTKPYKREFATRAICKFGLAPRDAVPSPKNTHAIQGPHGLYNVHNIGLPILLALPLYLGGVIGVKIFLVLLSGLAVLLLWCIANLYIPEDHKAKFGIVCTLTCALPLLPGASQIYPDMIAGLGALAGLYWLLTLFQEKDHNRDILFTCIVAYLPWLQIKFTATALIIISAVVWRLCQRKHDLARVIKILLLIIIS